MLLLAGFSLAQIALEILVTPFLYIPSVCMVVVKKSRRVESLVRSVLCSQFFRLYLVGSDIICSV
jgi:hypothetical protein